jgi:hypothetical protein
MSELTTQIPCPQQFADNKKSLRLAPQAFSNNGLSDGS